MTHKNFHFQDFELILKLNLTTIKYKKKSTKSFHILKNSNSEKIHVIFMFFLFVTYTYT